MIHCNLSLCSSLSYPHISTKNIYCTAQAKPVKHAKTPSNSDSLCTTNMQELKLHKERVKTWLQQVLLVWKKRLYRSIFVAYARPTFICSFFESRRTHSSYGYKSQIFSNLRENSNKILELGIGTGPNLKYYASNSVDVVGVDPNQKMEKYAKAAAVSTGLPSDKFKFIRAVGEALPIEDASIDAVVGTLVLCSVEDVNATLQEVRRVLKPGGLYLYVEHVAAKDGTILKFVQGILDPLQQTVADGCHLSRNTGASISSAGFSSVDMNMVFLPALFIIGPHVYGIARK